MLDDFTGQKDFKPENGAFTRFLAKFYAFPGSGYTGSTDSVEGRKTFGYLTSVTTRKVLGEPSGSFTLTFKRPPEVSEQDYAKTWNDPEGTWVLLQAIVNGELYDVMLGIIDSVSVAVQRSGNGQRIEVYQVFGRDVGKILEDTKIHFDPYLKSSVPGYTAVTELLGPRVINETPAGFAELLIDTWLRNDTAASALTSAKKPWELPPGLPGTYFADMLSLGIQPMTAADNGSMTDLSLFKPDIETTLWELLSQHANGMLNEMWIDLSGKKRKTGLAPTFFLRERPFPTYSSRGAWDAVVRHELQRRDVQMRQLSKGGGATRYNFWLFSPEGLQELNLRKAIHASVVGLYTPGEVPIINKRSVARFGLRPYLQKTLFMPSVPTATGESADVLEVSKAWTQKLFDWHSIAPKQFTGTLNLSHIFPEIRVGHRVLEKREGPGMEFYVEGVEHSWNYPGTGTTQLMVTRGQFDDEDLLKAEYAAIKSPVDSYAAVTASIDALVDSVSGMIFDPNEVKDLTEGL